MTSTLLMEKIDAILPQTQCGKCGYPGCMPYAEAIAKGEAEINKCSPGGEQGIRELAALMGVEFKPFEPDTILTPPAVALIDEKLCIGCTLCIQACPVDAIAGAAKLMHTVIAAECTGCELCITPCPENCISMLIQTGKQRDKKAAADFARERYRFRIERMARDKREKAEKLARAPSATSDAQALIQAALERAKAQAAAVKAQNVEQLTPAQQAKIAEIEARRAKAHEQTRPGVTPKKG